MKVLLIKTNNLLADKTIHEIRENIKKQINDGRVIVLDSMYTHEVVELDDIKCECELINDAGTK